MDSTVVDAQESGDIIPPQSESTEEEECIPPVVPYAADNKPEANIDNSSILTTLKPQELFETVSTQLKSVKPLIKLSKTILTILIIINGCREGKWLIEQWNGRETGMFFGFKNTNSSPLLFINRFILFTFGIWIYSCTMISIHTLQIIGYFWCKRIGWSIWTPSAFSLSRQSTILLILGILISKQAGDLWKYLGEVFHDSFNFICTDSDYYACQWTSDLPPNSIFDPELEKTVFIQLSMTILTLLLFIGHLLILWSGVDENKQTCVSYCEIETNCNVGDGNSEDSPESHDDIAINFEEALLQLHIINDEDLD